ncbi:MAG: heavy metal translocating P-type ATPase [Bacilli bacterium]|nr:heavy metal translocating P-type ATPase [Bacilli bacterium]
MINKILKSKNYISLICGTLIILGLIIKYTFHDEIIMSIFLILASIIGILPIMIQAYQALKIRVISIDLLVTIAVLGAFIIKNYEESSIVTFLFLFGVYLEQRTLSKTRSAIKELIEMAPESAFKLNDFGEYEEVDIDEVNVGDNLLVKTGNKVPVDGKVITGEGYINEASITGEPTPVHKTTGCKVYAGTILENGSLHIIAERVGEDTTFSKIIELVEEAQDAKSNAERFIDHFAKYYTPLVLLVALIVYLYSFNLELAITILVLGCPGALVIGIPVANVAGIGRGARSGILFKGSEVINDFSSVDTIVFDKTGTLTTGKPEVSEVKIYDHHNLDYTYALLVSIEKTVDHPLAKAIVNHFGVVSNLLVEKVNVIRGGGLKGIVDNKEVIIGNVTLLEDEKVDIPDYIYKDVNDLILNGHTIVLVSINNECKLLIGIKDQIRPTVKEELNRLKRFGVKNLVVLSGDNQGSVNILANELGINEAYGSMLPQDKVKFIEDLQKHVRVVAFVGDGVNDSPSLALANIGISLSSGTDVAIETSDVVLINNDFINLTFALKLSRKIMNNMKQNIAIALLVVVILLLSLIFGDWMNMTIGMFVHEASILAVILNSMRLLKYKHKKG